MLELKAIGYWKSPAEQHFPDPQKWEHHLEDDSLARLVVSHLRSGVEVYSWRGSSWCRFGCGIPHEKMGNRDLSDGTYIWPEGLAHYVETHHILLPEEFIRHVVSGVPLKLPINPYEVHTDFGWWSRQPE